MTDNVIGLPIVTKLDIDPDRVLREALGKCECVILLGYDKEGQEYFCSSVADGGSILWLLERFKKQLLEAADGEAWDA